MVIYFKYITFEKQNPLLMSNSEYEQQVYWYGLPSQEIKPSLFKRLISYLIKSLENAR